jgi:hypothetical protein
MRRQMELREVERRLMAQIGMVPGSVPEANKMIEELLAGATTGKAAAVHQPRGP